MFSGRNLFFRLKVGIQEPYDAGRIVAEALNKVAFDRYKFSFLPGEPVFLSQKLQVQIEAIIYNYCVSRHKSNADPMRQFQWRIIAGWIFYVKSIPRVESFGKRHASFKRCVPVSIATFLDPTILNGKMRLWTSKTSISLSWLNTRDCVELDNELDHHQD